MKDEKRSNTEKVFSLTHSLHMSGDMYYHSVSSGVSKFATINTKIEFDIAAGNRLLWNRLLCTLEHED